MKYGKILVTLFGVAVARAACEFPYYPEFADLYSQYEEVTPAMAKAATREVIRAEECTELSSTFAVNCAEVGVRL